MIGRLHRIAGDPLNVHRSVINRPSSQFFPTHFERIEFLTEKNP